MPLPLNRAPFGAASLAKGNNGSAVVELQKLLNTAYSAGLTADGDFGAKTDTALRSFQKAAGLPVTGAADDRTMAELRRRSGQTQVPPGAQTTVGPVPSGVAPPKPPALVPPGGAPPPKSTVLLKTGSRGAEVAELQTLLNAVDGANLTPDGDYGAKTATAVSNYQRKAQLPVTGEVDTGTLAQLQLSASAIMTPAGKAGPGPALPPPPPPAESGSYWSSLWTKTSDAWQSLAKSASQEWDELFAKDPKKAEPKVAEWMKEMDRVRANLRVMRDNVVATPKTDREKVDAENYKKALDRYSTLAAKFYAEARPQNESTGPKVGFVFIVVIIVAGLAISAASAAWAVKSISYAHELGNETDLIREELQARTALAKEGKTLPPSTVKRLPSEALKDIEDMNPLDDGGGMGAVGLGIVAVGVAAVGYGVYRFMQ